ncbi:src substrate cortactin [Paramuricea clavata]|uniref:Src substrate cortactin n=1 Tax=Paramuricea clavata TaxID=317549 RepID=A0A7D9DG88_PARCT|nr:src substrate cortactin [Paramuricea clavata]
MWRSAAGHNVQLDNADDDDWDTDPDFVNDVSEKEQRWGAKTVEGSGHMESINIKDLRQNVTQDHQKIKKDEASKGYPFDVHL